jgi:hypothetical protein
LKRLRIWKLREISLLSCELCDTLNEIEIPCLLPTEMKVARRCRLLCGWLVIHLSLSLAMNEASWMRILESARFPAAQTICSVRDAFCCRDITCAPFIACARSLSLATIGFRKTLSCLFCVPLSALCKLQFSKITTSRHARLSLIHGLLSHLRD